MIRNRSQKKIVYNCRKKVIFGERKVPKPTGSKLVWIINMEGSTFMPVGEADTFSGDSQVMQTMYKKVIPEINKNIGKIWIKQQQNTYKSQIFAVTHTIMKILLILLTLSLIVVLLASDVMDNIFPSILLICIYFIWLSSVIIVLYTYTRQYKQTEFQSSIVKQIKQILCQYNNLFFKCRRYVVKCDQWATWICLSPLDKQKCNSFQASSIDNSSFDKN